MNRNAWRKFAFAMALGSAAAAASANPARLALWITDSVNGNNGSRCQLTLPVLVPQSPPAFTDRDIGAWRAEQALWTVRPERLSGRAGRRVLEDHCFILVIDGKVIESGIVLSSHSERLTGFATLFVTEMDGKLQLQLTAGNHGAPMRLLHVAALDSVLAQARAH